MPSPRNQGIDALRGLAAFFVVAHHLYVPAGIGVPAYDTLLLFFNDYGTLGVDLFFVLSGFCIHWGHSRPGEPFSPKAYLLRRWWRIYPPYFFALGFAVILNLLFNAWKWKSGGGITWNNFGPWQILSHFFLIHNMDPATRMTINGVFWTIAVEAQFYLIYLLIRSALFSAKGSILAVTASALLCLTAIYFSLQGNAFHPLNAFIYWPEWIMGAWIAQAMRVRPVRSKAEYGVFWALFALFGATAYYGYWHGWNDTVQSTRYIWAAAFMFLVPAVMADSALSRALKSCGLPFLGLFSYSTYLIHFPIADRVRAFIIPNLEQSWQRLCVSLSTLILCYGFSWFFFKALEKPFLEKAMSIR